MCQDQDLQHYIWIEMKFRGIIFKVNKFQLARRKRSIMNPVRVFITIFSFGILLTFILGFIGYPELEGDRATGPESVNIEAFVIQACGGCHGGAELAGGIGPSLIGVELSTEEIIDILVNGQGSMPGGTARGREAEVADYLLTLQ
jgi:hypothetical protein